MQIDNEENVLLISNIGFSFLSVQKIPLQYKNHQGLMQPYGVPRKMIKEFL
jgi:hypothetical protein